MARPTKLASKRHTISARVDDKQYEFLRRQARTDGMDLSEYVLRMIKLGVLARHEKYEQVREEVEQLKNPKHWLDDLIGPNEAKQTTK